MSDGEVHIDSSGGNDHVASILLLYISSYCIISYYIIS
jgi:hypothetical protein